MKEKQCLQCNKEFERNGRSRAEFSGRSFCSHSCHYAFNRGENHSFYGKKHSEGSKAKMGLDGKDNPFFGKKHSSETKNKMRSIKKNFYKNGGISPLKGRGISESHLKNVIASHTTEYRKKQSEARKGERGANWKGGVSALNNRIRRSLEYRLWRDSVFVRDNYTCVECGERSKKGKSVVLNADHIEAFAFLLKKHRVNDMQSALICADLWNIKNGRTLCVPCHKKTDTYGSKIFNLKEHHGLQ